MDEPSMTKQAGRRQRTLWELLVWTYHDQKAHRYLRTPKDWFLWALADAKLVEDMPRPSVHADAALVHAAGLELDQSAAELVAFFSAENEQPDPPLAVPRPYPTEIDRTEGHGQGSRWSWAKIGGRRVDYLIRWTDYVLDPPIEMASAGRAATREQTIKLCPVEFCPL